MQSGTDGGRYGGDRGEYIGEDGGRYGGDRGEYIGDGGYFGDGLYFGDEGQNIGDGEEQPRDVGVPGGLSSCLGALQWG